MLGYFAIQLTNNFVEQSFTFRDVFDVKKNAPAILIMLKIIVKMIVKATGSEERY